MQILVPVLCMALFGLHPVGSQAFAYTLYWLIPVTLYIMSSLVNVLPRFQQFTPIFLQALSSTFIAHAVGSVIWLYTVGMTPRDIPALI